MSRFYCPHFTRGQTIAESRQHKQSHCKCYARISAALLALEGLGYRYVNDRAEGRLVGPLEGMLTGKME